VSVDDPECTDLVTEAVSAGMSEKQITEAAMDKEVGRELLIELIVQEYREQGRKRAVGLQQKKKLGMFGNLASGGLH
jgi:hypothetical protein